MVGRTVFASLLITSLLCTALAVADALRVETVTASVVLVAIVPWALAAVRSGHRPTIPRWVRSSRARAQWLALGLAGLASIALIIVPSHLRLGPGVIPATSTVWYYAHLAHEVARVGGFPESFPEWGTLRPFQTDYAPFTAHTAALFQGLGNDLLMGQEVYRLIVLWLGMLFAALLLRRFVSWWVAVLGAVLLVTTVHLEFKALAYKPETFGLVAALATIWITDRAVTERSRRLIVTAIAGAGLTFLAHAEMFLVLAAAIAAIGVTRGAKIGRGPIGVRPSGHLSAGVAAAAVLVGGLFVGTVGNAAIAGEFRLLGYAVSNQAVANDAIRAIPPERRPIGWQLSGDPTWDFYVAAAAPAQMGEPPPVRFTDPRLLPRSILHIWPGLDGRDREGLVLLAMLVASPFFTWPWLDARRRRLLLVWAVFGVVLLIGSYVLNEMSSTYVPRRAGGRRLMPYELMLPVGAAVFWLYAVYRLLAPGWQALVGRRKAAIASALALAVIVAGATAPAAGGSDGDESPGLSATGLQAYEWIRDNLPPDARILANAYTDGAMTALTDRSGLLDGRAVYLEDPEFLAEATSLVLGARRFFQTPGDPEVASFLAEHQVRWVLLVGPAGRGADLGGYRPFETDPEWFATSPDFVERTRFGEGELILYEAIEPSVGRTPAGPVTSRRV